MMLPFLVRVGPVTHYSLSIRRLWGVERIMLQSSTLSFPFTRCYGAAVRHGSAALLSSLSLWTPGECIMIWGRVRLGPFAHCSLSILLYSLSLGRGSGVHVSTGSGTAVVLNSLLSLDTAIFSQSF